MNDTTYTIDLAPGHRQVHEHRNRSCVSKRAYTEYASARRAAHRACARTGETIEVYWCHYCKLYHIGHRKERTQ